MLVLDDGWASENTSVSLRPAVQAEKEAADVAIKAARREVGQLKAAFEG